MWQDLDMHRVAVLCLAGVFPFELGIPLRVFGAATSGAGKPLYQLSTCTLDGEPVAAGAGLTITPEHDATILSTVDTVVIPPFDLPGSAGQWPARADAAAEVLRSLPSTTRLMSICTGAYVLAVAGLLDGRPATTHWQAAEHFRRTFPAVRLDSDVLFVDDGRLLTSAGAAAGVDLCLHVVRRDHGSDVANRAARTCVAPPWRDGGQAQYIERPVPDRSSASTAATRAWAGERLGQPLTLPELAEHAGMTVRTFNRHFRDEVGLTPIQWLTQQRIQHARHLLETSDLPIDQVAELAGLGGGSSLRQHFRAAVGISPTAYRRTFTQLGAPARL
jgi:transcriptional regulator GlxA family with amidase domain